MPEPTLADQITTARAYEGLHVPALFEAWAEPVLDAAGVESGDRVLDVACGTGICARTAVGRVGKSGAVTGLDPMQGMLAVAQELGPEVTWQQGMAESLPFPDASFDAVVSQFGLMFFTDRRAAISEMVRVLAPGGRLGIAVWDVLENSPAYFDEVALLDRIAGTAAGNALRAPFVLGDPALLHELFDVDGIESVEVLSTARPARFPSIRIMIEADLRGWLPVMGVDLSEEKIQEILDEAEIVFAKLLDHEGRVVFEESGHIVAARKEA